MYGLDGQTVSWTENLLNGQAQRVVLSGTEAVWRPITSRAARGIIVGLVLLSMLISEPDDGAECASCKSADDIKMGEAADALGGCAATQSSIKRQEKWADGKLVKVTKRKQKVLHVGRKSHIHQRIVGIVLLGNCLAEDL